MRWSVNTTSVVSQTRLASSTPKSAKPRTTSIRSMRSCVETGCKASGLADVMSIDCPRPKRRVISAAMARALIRTVASPHRPSFELELTIDSHVGDHHREYALVDIDSGDPIRHTLLLRERRACFRLSHSGWSQAAACIPSRRPLIRSTRTLRISQVSALDCATGRIDLRRSAHGHSAVTPTIFIPFRELNLVMCRERRVSETSIKLTAWEPDASTLLASSARRRC